MFSKGRSNHRCKMFLPLKKVRIRCVWILRRVIVRGKFSSRGVLQTETSDYHYQNKEESEMKMEISRKYCKVCIYVLAEM